MLTVFFLKKIDVQTSDSNNYVLASQYHLHSPNNNLVLKMKRKWSPIIPEFTELLNKGFVKL